MKVRHRKRPRKSLISVSLAQLPGPRPETEVSSTSLVFNIIINDLISIRRELREMSPRPRMRREVLVVKKVVLKVTRGRRRRKRRKMQARKTRPFRLLQSQKKRRRGHQQRQKQ